MFYWYRKYFEEPINWSTYRWMNKLQMKRADDPLNLAFEENLVNVLRVELHTSSGHMSPTSAIECACILEHFVHYKLHIILPGNASNHLFPPTKTLFTSYGSVSIPPVCHLNKRPLWSWCPCTNGTIPPPYLLVVPLPPVFCPWFTS